MLRWKNISQDGDVVGGAPGTGSVFWASVLLKPSGIVSSSIQIQRIIPNLVSSSAQISYIGITNRPSGLVSSLVVQQTQLDTDLLDMGI